MTKQIIVFFTVFAVMLSAFPLSAFAVSDDDEYYFGDYDDSKFNPVHNEAEAFKAMLHGVQDMINGDITPTEYVQNLTDITKANISADVNGFVNDVITNVEQLENGYDTVDPRNVYNNIVNGINEHISSKGGNVSGFPSGNTTVSAGQGYIVFEPYTAWHIYSDGNSRYEIYATVYYNNGTVARSKGRVFDTAPQGYVLDGGGGILSISYTSSQDLGDVTRMYFDCDCYYWSYPNILTRNFSVDVPWVVGDSAVDTTNLTPDVGVLSDDDFYRYIDRLINNLDNTYPDMSTLDGKLQEILNKMDNLGNGCNCAELAASINALLDYLRENGGNSDNTELNNTLTELNNTLKNDIDLKPIQDKLDKIYNVLKNIYYELGDDYTADKAKQDVSDSFDELKKKIEDKFHITTIKNSIDNFSNAIFGKAAFENDKETGQLMVASVYGDGSRSASDVFYPLSLEIEYEGKKYDLFKWSGFIPATTMSTFRGFVRFILWITFLIGLFRSIPGMLGGFDQLSAPIDRELSKGFNDGYKNG